MIRIVFPEPLFANLINLDTTWLICTPQLIPFLAGNQVQFLLSTDSVYMIALGNVMIGEFPDLKLILR